MRKNVRVDRNEPLISFQLNDTADVIIKPSLNCIRRRQVRS